MVTLKLDKLNKHYGSTHALKDFSAELSNGIYGLLGPNGAGKTTLLNILSCNLEADSGTLTLDPEFNILENIGYMPQQQEIYREFSAIDFLYYMSSLKNLKGNEDEIEHLLEVVNLSDVKHKKIGSFSGGMKQRILLAQALLGNPKIVLLDEPTAGLDPAERINMRNFISEFSDDKIIIYATHVVSDIEFIAKEIIFLRKGQNLGIKTTEEWQEEIFTKVFEIYIPESELSKYKDKYHISNISRVEGKLRLRIVSEEPVPNAEIVPARLEDVYLYLNNINAL